MVQKLDVQVAGTPTCVKLQKCTVCHVGVCVHTCVCVCCTPVCVCVAHACMYVCM